jgi:hypothetical protein
VWSPSPAAASHPLMEERGRTGWPSRHRWWRCCPVGARRRPPLPRPYGRQRRRGAASSAPSSTPSMAGCVISSEPPRACPGSPHPRSPWLTTWWWRKQMWRWNCGAWSPGASMAASMSTIGVEFATAASRSSETQIWDTAGQERCVLSFHLIITHFWSCLPAVHKLVCFSRFACFIFFNFL